MKHWLFHSLMVHFLVAVMSSYSLEESKSFRFRLFELRSESKETEDVVDSSQKIAAGSAAVLIYFFGAKETRAS